MPKTSRGVYHNLKESEYVVSNGDATFFFSSELYLNKFIDGYRKHREEFNNRMNRITDAPLNMDMLADITFYNKVEKRGFHAWLKGVNTTWREIHIYALRTMTEKHTRDWSRTRRLKLAERRRSTV